MGSAFDTRFDESALPRLWDQHASTDRFTFTPAGGAATAYDATIGQERIERDRERQGQVVGYSRRVVVQDSDLSDPKVNATVAVDGVSYVIRSRKSGAGAWTLDLFRSALSEVSGAGYRRTTG